MDEVTIIPKLLGSKCLYSVTTFMIAFKKEKRKVAGTLEYYIFVLIYLCILLQGVRRMISLHFLYC